MARIRAARTAMMGPPGGQFRGASSVVILARIWHEGRSGTQSADQVGPSPWPLTWFGAGDGNRARIVSLGTAATRPLAAADLHSAVPDLASTNLSTPPDVARAWPGLVT